MKRGVLVTVTLALSVITATVISKPNTSGLFRDGQRALRRKDYDGAIEKLQAFVVWARPSQRVSIALDQIGRIRLCRQQRGPELVAFLRNLRVQGGVNFEQQDIIDEWLAAAKERERYDVPEGCLEDADLLYSTGIQLYASELRKDPDLFLATTDVRERIARRLVPFVFHFPGDKRISSALLALGHLRSTMWSENADWVAQFYFKEVIRRSPHTREADRAAESLEQVVHLRFTGSSGDHTPASLRRMLSRYRRLAQPSS